VAEKKKIIVAMSGGVDSSVAAALLAREGHEVVGVTMRLLPGGSTGFGCCGAPEDAMIAKRSAEKIGIPHYALDYAKEFEEKVVNYFVNSYLVGETPNPCLACNRHIKFDRLKTFAASLGCTHIATGHYARVEKDGDLHRLYEAVDPTKDQSYVLFNFNQEGLASTLFPVGGRPKSEIRDMARQFDLPNADKKDSQEICFVPKRDYAAFIDDRLKIRGETAATAAPGPILDESGKNIGQHKGAAFYTVGQRSGLSGGAAQKMYVTRIDAASNTVVVGPDQKNMAVGLSTVDMNWIQPPSSPGSFEALVKIRYKHEPAPATVETTGREAVIRFHEPQRAVSPGQAAVVYRWDEKKGAREVLGGGKISSAMPL
jgi:tRNA-uridine 2-sulfurtransferase